MLPMRTTAMLSRHGYYHGERRRHCFAKRALPQPCVGRRPQPTSTLATTTPSLSPTHLLVVLSTLLHCLPTAVHAGLQCEAGSKSSTVLITVDDACTEDGSSPTVVLLGSMLAECVPPDSAGAYSGIQCHFLEEGISAIKVVNASPPGKTALDAAFESALESYSRDTVVADAIIATQLSGFVGLPASDCDGTCSTHSTSLHVCTCVTVGFFWFFFGSGGSHD